MFTGLIEEVGTILSIARKGEAMVIGITASLILNDLKLGDSISVNGVCLTATEVGSRSFMADVMPQTYRSSNLSKLKNGSKVNLERAMAASGRFGGHIVQGHVDGTGHIKRITRDQNSVVYEVEPEDPGLFKYIIAKGSVTIDGISLTVAERSNSSFAVSIIPHTLSETALEGRLTGDTLNIECDILGKYVDHLLNYGKQQTKAEVAPSTINLEYLARHGFV